MANNILPSEPFLAKTSVKSARILPIQKGFLGLCVEPDGSTDLACWAQAHKDWIESTLPQTGALLFRGFNVRSVTDFERFIVVSSDRWAHYREAATPRSAVTENVATSTEYPSTERILLHNENSHCTTWPGKIYFWCEDPAESGGETPIADCRRIYDRIEEKIRHQFIERGILYVRNYTPGLGISWDKSLNCTTKSEIEVYAREQDMKAEWMGTDHLRLQYRRSAVVRHPITHRLVWFNHGTFFNMWALKCDLREMLLEAIDINSLPYNTYFGDGEPITEELVKYLMECYDNETVIWSWKRGDVLLLDNMLMAHGRMPFTGKRRVLTGMANPIHYRAPELMLFSPSEISSIS